MKCPICQFMYEPSLPADRAEHQHAHHQTIRAVEPKPTKRFLRAIRRGLAGEQVKYRAARWKNEEMYARACMFRREFGYGFCDWDVTGNDLFANGFLFNDDTGTFGHGAIAGACSIRWEEIAKSSGYWSLIWVWIAPPARRKGILTRRWPSLLKSYSDLQLSEPVSEAMAAFIVKQQHK